ncbi:MAG: hypothetical protein R2695_02905 [Acidimicrobiales bacterium]
MFRRNDPITTPLRESDLARAVPDRELEVLETIGTAVRFDTGRTAMVEDGVGSRMHGRDRRVVHRHPRRRGSQISDRAISWERWRCSRAIAATPP